MCLDNNKYCKKGFQLAIHLTLLHLKQPLKKEKRKQTYALFGQINTKTEHK